MVKIVEYSYKQAWNIIQETNNLLLSEDNLPIIYVQSYLNQYTIKKYIEYYGYSDKLLIFRKFKKPFLFHLIPIPTPHNFILYDINLNNIYQLAKSCDNFLMFELLILKRDNKIDLVRDMLLKNNSPIFYHIETIKRKNHSYFFYGFDFDDQSFESGISKVSDYNFVPAPLTKYFW